LICPLASVNAQDAYLILPGGLTWDPPILDTVEAHLITGSEREKETDGSLGDYVDGCESHFLLADAYSALAAAVCDREQIQYAPPIVLFENTPQSRIVAAWSMG